MDLLDKIKRSDYFSYIDCHFAQFLMGISQNKDDIIGLSAALVSRSNREGHVCIDLVSLAGGMLEAEQDQGGGIVCPGLDQWRDCLDKSDLVGKPGEYRPLIKDEIDRLYLHRYWEYENDLIDLLKGKAQNDYQDVNIPRLKEDLQRLFPESEAQGINPQKIAAAIAVLKRLCVITGGPGTGKTFAIARILATINQQYKNEELKICLAAPTGKAAARLAEAIAQAKQTMESESEILEAIPNTCSTIHRLLKPIKDSPKFYYNRENHLPADVVVIDEASMVDLPLMSRLVESFSENTRLILMGDKHQLASVEAGSVLGDICGDIAGNQYHANLAEKLEAVTGYPSDQLCGKDHDLPPIQDSMTTFTHSYRFEEEGGIRVLANAVNQGAADEVIDILSNEQYSETNWIPMESPQQAYQLIVSKIIEHYAALADDTDPHRAFERLNRFRVLCAVNQGLLGVEGINALARDKLHADNKTKYRISNKKEWYHGIPIIVTTNDYHLGLFNGDVGVVMTSPDKNEPTFLAYFGDEPGGDLRYFSPYRLPGHQDVYSMTIHKSQGSEFDEILMVLPQYDSPLLTRELLYTGITRVRQKLSILAPESVIRSAVLRRIERVSGLRDALWKKK